jgi:hypothetical protein
MNAVLVPLTPEAPNDIAEEALHVTLEVADVPESV